MESVLINPSSLTKEQKTEIRQRYRESSNLWYLLCLERIYGEKFFKG